MFSMNICEPFVLSLASREERYLVSLLNHGKGVGAGGTIILLSVCGSRWHGNHLKFYGTVIYSYGIN